MHTRRLQQHSELQQALQRQRSKRRRSLAQALWWARSKAHFFHAADAARSRDVCCRCRIVQALKREASTCCRRPRGCPAACVWALLNRAALAEASFTPSPLPRRCPAFLPFAGIFDGVCLQLFSNEGSQEGLLPVFASTAACDLLLKVLYRLSSVLLSYCSSARRLKSSAGCQLL
jgi:hypothetical protein